MANYLLNHTGAQIDEGIDVALRSSGYRNKLINGSLQVWQLGTSFTIPAGQWAWTADQIYVVNTTNQPVTIAQSRQTIDNNLLSTLTVTFSTAPTSGEVLIEPIVPEATTLQNGPVALSFHCGSAEAMTISADVVQDFGSSGSANVYTNLAGSFTSGPNVSRHSFTGTLPSVSGKSLSAYHKIYPRVHLPIRTTNPVTLAMIQLERGNTATPFEMLSYEDELSRCLPFVQILDKVAIARLVDSITFGGSLTVITYSPMHHAPSVLLTHLNGSGTYATVPSCGVSSGYIDYAEPLPAVGSWEIFKVTLTARI